MLNSIESYINWF